MKTKILRMTAALGLVALFTNCSKDDDTPTYSEYAILSSYLTTSGFDGTVTNRVNSGDYEFGLEFMPTVEGKITALNVKLPDANPTLRITIWDKATATALRTETVNVAAAATNYTFDISDLSLTKDKEYAITMNSNDWYERRRTGGTAATYPINVSDIKILNYKWRGGTTQTYPTNVDNTYYAGDVTFSFQRTQ